MSLVSNLTGKFSLPLNRATLLPAITLSVLMIGLFYLLPGWFGALFYERGQVAQGQWWRLLTAQLVHFDQPHLWLNVLGLWLWWLLFIEYLPRWRSWLWLLPIMLVSSLGHMLGEPDVNIYAGFSGTLYGLFAYGSIRDILGGRYSGWLILVPILGKNIYDLLYLPPTSDIAVPAHLAGITAGAVIAMLLHRGNNLDD
ncbi:rhombosortase [Pseudidiomarina sp.]|uniref:rhombosortase n=1 Tax=Pseudidiomarina sp. TaxID=2081707 RepID=UPI00299E7FC9|nr:rhombosortase [Pseudidiomarina sp.]MDX1705280.1 rhombosortase [Pseudidiomarina sp.]